MKVRYFAAATIALLAATVIADRTHTPGWIVTILATTTLAAAACGVALDVRNQWTRQAAESPED